MRGSSNGDRQSETGERVAIFIDGSNLYHSLEENCSRFDVYFAALSTKLCKGRRPLSTYRRHGKYGVKVF